MVTKQSRFVTRKLDALRAFYGSKCMNPECETIFTLEFCHIRPTYLKGMGRGSMERSNDIAANRRCYCLLCRSCHYLLDSGDATKSDELRKIVTDKVDELMVDYMEKL